MRKIYLCTILAFLSIVMTGISTPALARTLAPFIVQQPNSVVVACGGGSAFFTVVTTGDGLTYQWYHFNDPIPGATQASYVIPSVAANNQGQYHVVVTKAGVGEPEHSVTVELTIRILSLSGEYAGFLERRHYNYGGEPTTFIVNALGGGLVYQWYRNESAIPGETGPTYTVDPVDASHTQGNYKVTVSGVCDPPVNAYFTIVRQALIVRQPESAVVACVGDPATFTVVAAGEGLMYQWYHYGLPIPGAVQASYRIPSVSASHQGDYSVRVRKAGMLQPEKSMTVTLTIRIVGLSGDYAGFLARRHYNCGGEPTTFSVNAMGSDLKYQWYRNTDPIPGATGPRFTIDTVTASHSQGFYRVEVSGSCGPPVSAYFYLTRQVPVRLFGWSESKTRLPSSIVTYDVSFSIRATGSDLKYQWYKDGVPINRVPPFGRGDSIFINNATPADAGIYSVRVYNNCSSELSGGMRLLIGYSAGPADRSVCSGQTVRFVAPDTTDIYLYQWRKDGVDIPGATSFFLEFPAELSDQGLYTVAIILKGSAVEMVTPPGRLTVTQSVEFITEPQSQILCYGEPLRLRSEAIGTGLTYQWSQSGSLIPGATEPTYEVPFAIPSNSGHYHVTVTGECGAVRSEAAFVTVAALTVIEEQPVGRTVSRGEGATFFVTATGTDLRYQWRKNGEDMVDYIDTFITIASATPENEGTYDVVITDGCNKEHVSDPAVLVVLTPSTVLEQIAAIEMTSKQKATVVARPHPASGLTRLEIRLPENLPSLDRASLSLYDMRGDHRFDIDIEHSDGLVNRASFDASGLSTGVYHLRLNINGHSQPLGSIVVE